MLDKCRNIEKHAGKQKQVTQNPGTSWEKRSESAVNIQEICEDQGKAKMYRNVRMLKNPRRKRRPLFRNFPDSAMCFREFRWLSVVFWHIPCFPHALPTFSD